MKNKVIGEFNQRLSMNICHQMEQMLPAILTSDSEPACI